MNIFDEPYKLNLDNRNLVASLSDCPPTTEYGNHISDADKELIANLRLSGTDCGRLDIYKYSKCSESSKCSENSLKTDIMEHHINGSPGCPPDNSKKPRIEPNTYDNGECVFYWCRTIDGTPLKYLLERLFGVDKFLSCLCFSIEQNCMYLSETPDHHWVFDLHV